MTDLLPLSLVWFSAGSLHAETAVLRVLSDILQAVDRGHSVALVLDLSAAFDTREVGTEVT